MKAKAAALILCCASLSWAACPKGSTEWKGGCAADLKPQGGPDSVQPSDEKPPKDKMPSYEREGIKAIDIPSFKTEAEEADAQIKYAQAHDTAKKPDGK